LGFVKRLFLIDAILPQPLPNKDRKEIDYGKPIFKAAQTLNAVRKKKPLIHNLIAACVYFLPPQQGPVMFIGKKYL